MTNIPTIDIYLNDKIKIFENKLSTYIDIYYKKHDVAFEKREYEGLQPSPSLSPSPSLERIGNIEILYKNFTNNNKKISKNLRYSIYKLDILLIIESCNYILHTQGIYFDFINYNYDLYNVNNDVGIKNIYIIHKKIKGLIFKFEGPCIIYILIRDKLFIHYY